MPAPTRARARAIARDDVVRLARRRLPVGRLVGETARALRRAVPFDGVCLVTLDPATLLPTAEIVENALDPAAVPRLTEIELREPDYNKFTALARADRPAASLGEATGGALDRSLRQRELRHPNGFADELRLVCTDATGAWGALTLSRETGRAPFTPSDVRFLASLSSPLAGGLRGAAFTGNETPDEVDRAGVDALAGRRAAGVVVLAPDNAVELANADADAWLARLAPAATCGALPVAVLAVAAHARRKAGEAGDASADGDRRRVDRPATVRVRAVDGGWIAVRGSLLGEGERASVAVLIEDAGGPELAPLIADAYGLTERERRVTELVAQGLSTAEIGGRMALAAYTIQDHLKSIFDKTGASSRGDLVARLYFDHYAPRLRTSELD